MINLTNIYYCYIQLIKPLITQKINLIIIKLSLLDLELENWPEKQEKAEKNVGRR